MQIAQPSKASGAVEERNKALQSLVTAVTSRPVDPDAVAKARKALVDTSGGGGTEGSIVEAAGILGYKEAMTKIADATGKKQVSSFIWIMLRFIFGIFRFVYEKCRWISGSPVRG